MPTCFVTAKDTQFQLNGAAFPVSGVNCYFLAYCNDGSRRQAMTTAKQMGATVIRTWAFWAVEDFVPGGQAFQYFKDGNIVINDGPNGLERLDALIKAAEDLDVKLILPLINYWEALGGMPTYVNWLSPGSDVTEFYRAPALRFAYQTWVNQLLTRRNTITGRSYSDEPAIMAWELTNEARCQISGGRELLLDWINEMSAFVKRLDSKHLLALGDEGFFYKKGSGDLYDGSHGVDWAANLAIPDVDFGTYHFYPQVWGHAHDLNFATRWITDHQTVAAGLNKPAVMEEFGLSLDNINVKSPADRNQWFGRWMQTVRDTGTAGSLLWMLGLNASDTAGYKDPYVIYEPAEVPSIASKEGLPATAN
jgi:mannan endo-1,4-beta-mannosidase